MLSKEFLNYLCGGKKSEQQEKNEKTTDSNTKPLLYIILKYNAIPKRT